MRGLTIQTHRLYGTQRLKTEVIREAHSMSARAFAKYWLFLLPLVFVLACVAANAQQNSQISGTVTDKEGAVVPDADITLTATATGYTNTTKSNGAGLYIFPGLNVGAYDLKVSAKGFGTTVQKGIQVNVSDSVRTDIVLSVGSVNEVIEVAANALTVQADSNVVSTLISAEQISEIATQNRNFAALAA